MNTVIWEQFMIDRWLLELLVDSHRELRAFRKGKDRTYTVCFEASNSDILLIVMARVFQRWEARKKRNNLKVCAADIEHFLEFWESFAAEALYKISVAKAESAGDESSHGVVHH